MPAKIVSFSISRLYNLGSYEHVKYDLAVSVPDGESVEAAFRKVEEIMRLLDPKLDRIKAHEINTDRARLQRMQDMTTEEWNREFAYANGTRDEIVARYHDDLSEKIRKHEDQLKMHAAARAALDNLGGNSLFKDAKQDWDSQDDGY